VTQERSMESCKQTLAKLTEKGIAIFHEGPECQFIAHRSIHIQSVLDSISPEKLNNLRVQLPFNTLIAPVSQEQERNLYHSEVMKQSAWNIQHIYELTITTLDISLLNKAMAQVVKNHDLLRTYYMPLGNSWAQIIMPDAILEIRPLDMPGLPEFKRFIAKQRNNLLRLDTPPLLQAWTCRINETCYLGFVTHHSLSDAFTTTMLFSELMGYYHSLLKEQTLVLKPIDEQYWQYSLSQFNGNIYRGSKTLQYWREQLADSVLSMQLPYARDPQKVDQKLLQVADGNMISLSSSISEEIRRFGQDHEITYTQLFTTAVTMLLIHGMGNSRAIVQFINNQRDRASLINTLGEFTNVLFIPFGPFEMDPELGIIEVLRKVKRKSLNSLRFAKVDFSELLALTGLDNYEGYYRQSGDVIINSADIDAGTLDSSERYGRSLFADTLSKNKESHIEGRAVATLFYQILKMNQRIHLITSYRKHLFEKSDIQQLSALIVQIVEEMIHNPEQKVKGILSRMHNSIEKLKKQANRYKLIHPLMNKKPLSEGQKGLWLLQKLEPGMTAYNIPIALKINDNIQADILKQACGFILKKHPILQTAFTSDEQGTPLQYINKERPLCFNQQSIQSLSEDDLLKLLKTTFKQPFRLDHDPLMRVHLFSRSENEHILLVIIHHIIFDGTSILVFINDLLSAYKTYSQGQQPVFKSGETTSYFDFVDWEQDLLSNERGEKHLAYWQEQLAGELPLLKLPIDKTRPARQTYSGATCPARLSAELTEQLRHMAREQGVSLFVLLLGIYKALLYRYSNQEDIIVGLPTIGRPEKRFEQTLGYFINMAPLRSTINGNESFSSYLEQLRWKVAYALDHSEYPFPKLVSQLHLKAGTAYSPVFQTLFVLQNFFSIQAKKELSGKNPDISMIPGLHQEGDFDLSLEMIAGEREITIHLSYNSDLFLEETIIGFIDHYIKLAQEIIQNPDQAIAQYDLLNKEERHKLLIEWNSNQVDYPIDKCVHELIETRAKITPGTVAVVFEGRQLTYGELNQKSTRLAKYLQSLGVKPNTLIAICVERSLEMIVGLLGILKSGGAYVPLDPEYPDKRLRYMLEDCQTGILLTRESLSEKMVNLVDKDIQIICLDKEVTMPDTNNTLLREVQPEHPAYVIYTSGSTGRPKGALISHGSIVNHCQVVQNYYNLSSDDHILQFASLNVDASLEQILPGLMTGAMIIIRDREIWSPEKFLNKVSEYGITVIDIPPAYLHELLLQWSNSQKRAMEELRLVITGGEAITPETVELWQKSPVHSIRLINAYGPTETTITSTAFEIKAQPKTSDSLHNIPIGRPLENEMVYILDRYGNPVPVGVPGELHISGTGLALGYLNRPELTRERFIDNPFKPGTRMYKTGDMARWLPDGNIEYSGRIDQQVKVRGFRIECGEIESILKEQETIENALVIAKTIKESTQLIACLVPADPGSPMDTGQLKKALQTKLPDYMIPSAFVSLDKIPLTPGGKTDRKALTKQNIELTESQEYVAPETETEKELSKIWGKVLGVEQIGIKDNFFDHGGHSLLSVRLMAEIHKKFGKDLSISTLFQAPNIKEQGNILDLEIEKTHELWTPLVSIKPEGNKTPFFCAHPVGGNVLSYNELANHFGNQYPFYGLESPGLNGADHPGSIEGLASIYIEAILKIQPHGPYQLGGWSMGGLIAYEMAQQLEQAGEEIALVTLIESYIPQAVKSFEESYIKENNFEKYDQEALLLLSFARDLGLYEGEIPISLLESIRKPGELLEQILDRAKSSDILPSEMKSERLYKLFKVFNANTLAMNDYQPRPLESQVILFCANGDKEEITIQDPARGWSELLDGNLEISRIPGTHYTILQKPNVGVLVGKLREYLQ